MPCRSPPHLPLGSFVLAMALAITGCGRMILGRLPAQDGGSDSADASHAADEAADRVVGDVSDVADSAPDSGPVEPRPDAGTVAWIKDGTAMVDDTGRLFLSV